MTEALTWVGVLVAVAALVLGWVTYRSQRNRKRLEYLVLSNQQLVSRRVASDLEVTFQGRDVPDPSLVVIRIVSTGVKGIPAATFETPIAVTLHGADEIISTSTSALKPPDLPIKLRIEGNRVIIDPLLLNAEDLIELQALAAGQVRDVTVEARIVDVEPMRRASLPYPPGTGAEGEMLGFDKFMWWGVPLLIFGLTVGLVWTTELSAIARFAWIIAAAVLFLVIYPINVKRLVRRRRIWTP